jgi:flavin-dependent dehydrogenase
MASVEVMTLATGKTAKFHAALVIDASGRNTRVTTCRRQVVRGSRLFGFKAHLKDVDGIAGQVELYFFAGGYGGLSSIEDGLANLCFITDETRLKKAGGNPLSLLLQTALTNSRARERLSSAKVEGNWVSGGPLMFGRKRRFEPGVIAIGDAGGMIDPFTGTGIQIALRSGELAAEATLESLGSHSTECSFDDRPAGRSEFTNADHHAQRSGLAASVLRCYSSRYDMEFGKRMRIAGLLRAPAFSPRMASVFGRVLSASPRLARAVLRGSRASQRLERQDERLH